MGLGQQRLKTAHLPPLRHLSEVHGLLVEAPGFRRYEAEVDITSNTVTPHTVQLQSATVAVTTPPTTTPTATPASTGPAADCANPQVGVRNDGRVCYGLRPTPRTPPATPAPASCAGSVRPTTCRFA